MGVNAQKRHTQDLEEACSSFIAQLKGLKKSKLAIAQVEIEYVQWVLFVIETES